jgi:predicted CXXCH cytochrome family protein
MRPRFASAIGLVLMFCVALWSTQAFSVANVATTKHNLSISGPGGIKSTTETEVCVFCHVPHNASNAAPLWNRASPTGTYTPYSSTTAKGNMGQPNGTSLLCLSCHDGTIAPGELLSRGATKVPMLGVDTATGRLLPNTSSNLGTDLSNDHPISIAYTAALATNSGGELASPATLTGKVKLDASGQMQCSSCHDPHDNTIPKFLVVSNTASGLCITCHTKAGWSASSHATSTATWTATGTNPWPHTSETTVAGNACENCHQPHTAAGKARLLNSATDETNCYNCHTGTVAGQTAPIKNMQSEMIKISGHAVANYSGLHDPVEANKVDSATRHIECADCHNPHQTNNKAGTTTTASGSPTLPGALNGVKGIMIDGTEIATVTMEYQVCLKCHGDSTGKKASTITRAVPSGAAGENNVRLEFQTTNASFHPVAGVGKSNTAPSLIAPLTASSIITCSACHNNNTGVGAGSTGPKGPHGSTISPLLERTYATADNTTESAANYALCYKCHSQTSIKANSAGSFRYHSLHLGVGAPCSACHDPHGVSTNQHLINFDPTIAKANTPNAVPIYLSTGVNKGSCNLTCHNKNHNPYTY